MRRRNTPGAYFFSHGRRFARSIPSINIFAKENCFQGAFLLNNGCTARGMVGPRGSRRRVGASLQLGHVVQVFEEHLHEDMIMPCKSKMIKPLLRPYDLRRWVVIGRLG